MTFRPAMTLRLGQRETALDPAQPLLMGIVNASPESFSDANLHPDAEAQVAHGLRLVAEGAAIVDVGGESGVTDRPPISAAEEVDRVLPVVEPLARAGATISIDTWKAPVARAALEAGATLVNDPSGLHDPELARVCAERGAPLVLTHTRARPKVKAFLTPADVAGDAVAFLRARIAFAEAQGVAAERIVVDPGLDLGKTPAQSIELLGRLGELHALGRPILLAPSRKDFVGALTGRSPADRLAGTLAAVEAGASAGAAILRVHDVAATADFLAVRRALIGTIEPDPALRLPEQLRREPEAA